MKWTNGRDENGIVIHRSTEGHEVWKDHEWLDREGPNFTGPMRKREGFMLRYRNGKEEGLFSTLNEAKAAAVKGQT